MSGRNYASRICLDTLVMFSAFSLRAQDPPPTQDPTAQSSSDGSTSAQQPSDSSPKSTVPVPAEMQVHFAGKTNPLLPSDSSLRWGHLYIRTLEFFQSYDQISNATSGTQGIYNQASFNASVFRTAIVYDQPLKKSRLAVEYSPRLTIVNGNVSSDFADQYTNLSWVNQLSPRWTLGIASAFSYYSVRHLYGDYFLDVNTVVGTNVPSSFLDGGGSWLNSNSSVSVAYALSPTSSISVSPFYSYGRVGGQIVAAQDYSIHQYGAKVRWQKQLAPSRSIFVLYYPRIVYDHGSGVTYHEGEFGYMQGIGASTTLSFAGGLLSQGFASGRDFTFSGSAQLSRKFGHSNASVAYFRGFPLFSELASQGVAQRVDGTYRLDMVRWYWQAQGGYEDSLSSKILDISGKYVATEFGYNLTPQWTTYFTYGRKMQEGNVPSLLVGTREFFSGGIRWTARSPQ
jgi:hypothetical protein